MMFPSLDRKGTLPDLQDIRNEVLTICICRHNACGRSEVAIDVIETRLEGGSFAEIDSVAEDMYARYCRNPFKLDTEGFIAAIVNNDNSA